MKKICNIWGDVTINSSRSCLSKRPWGTQVLMVLLGKADSQYCSKWVPRKTALGNLKKLLQKELPDSLFIPNSNNSGKSLIRKNLWYFLKKTFFLYLGKWNFVVLRLMEFLYFLKKYFFYFFGKWNFLKNLFFPEGIYQARKIKKSHFDKTSYILRNGTF